MVDTIKSFLNKDLKQLVASDPDAFPEMALITLGQEMVNCAKITDFPLKDEGREEHESLPYFAFCLRNSVMTN